MNVKSLENLACKASEQCFLYKEASSPIAGQTDFKLNLGVNVWVDCLNRTSAGCPWLQKSATTPFDYLYKSGKCGSTDSIPRFYDGLGRCEKCQKGCLACETEASRCSKCDPELNYVLSTHPKDKQYKTCTLCEPGTFSVAKGADTGLKCEGCIDNCLKCVGTSENCLKCNEASNFILQETGQDPNKKKSCTLCGPKTYAYNNMCNSCPTAGCLACAGAGGKICTKCDGDAGFILQGDACVVQWKLIFRQTAPAVGDKASWMLRNEDKPKDPNYSILEKAFTLNMRQADGRFLLKIVWPERTSNNYNIWKQLSNPF